MHFPPALSDPHSLALDTKCTLAAMNQVESIISRLPVCLDQTPEGEAGKIRQSLQPWTSLWDKSAVSPHRAHDITLTSSGYSRASTNCVF